MADRIRRLCEPPIVQALVCEIQLLTDSLQVVHPLAGTAVIHSVAAGSDTE